MAAYTDSLVMDAELDQRIAVLRRYRRMLELQRTRLQDYLDLLDTREAAVTRGDFAGLETYTLLEQQVIKGIMDVQLCIEPLAEMYRQVAPDGSQDIDELQQRLEKLRQKVLIRNEESRSLLKEHMSSLKAEIDSLRVPNNTASVFTHSTAPQMIDLKA